MAGDLTEVASAIDSMQDDFPYACRAKTRTGSVVLLIKNELSGAQQTTPEKRKKNEVDRNRRTLSDR
jgi:hypothetical protein